MPSTAITACHIVCSHLPLQRSTAASISRLLSMSCQSSSSSSIFYGSVNVPLLIENIDPPELIAISKSGIGCAACAGIVIDGIACCATAAMIGFSLTIDPNSGTCDRSSTPVENPSWSTADAVKDTPIAPTSHGAPDLVTDPVDVPDIDNPHMCDTSNAQAL